MESASVLYPHSPVAQLVHPWLVAHLPQHDSVIHQRLTQLTVGLMEETDVRIEQIALSSIFRGTKSSNCTQVRRILRDSRINVDTVYLPLIRSLLAEIAAPTIYLAFDESSHTNAINLFQVTVLTDAMALPLSFFLYEPSDSWADDARQCLTTLASCIPLDKQVIVLADRLHAGHDFITCLEALGWSYVIRLAHDTQIMTDSGWKAVKSLHPRRYPTRTWTDVRVWKTRSVRANVVVHRHESAGQRPVVWYVLTNLPPSAECCAVYAVRWWQECGFKTLKSAVFAWERSRVRAHDRVEVLLIGVACATWLLWMLGRWHEPRPRRKPTTTTPQPRRERIIRMGMAICADLCTHRRVVVRMPLPVPRVLEYERTFAVPN